MTNIPDIKQTTIQIGSQEVNGYKLGTAYFMSQKQVAGLLGKPNTTAMRFFTSNKLKAIQGEDPTAMRLPLPLGGNVSLVDTLSVASFISHWAFKGDPKAQKLALELMQQNLDIRIENALEPIKAEKVAELTGQSPEWLECREDLKRIHGAFQVACERKHHPAWLVHDAITFMVTGKTAEMARAEPLVGSDDSIGLDHQPVTEDLRMIARIKLRYSGLKAGTWQEQVNRAYSAIAGN